jgi:hypothetical protein
VDGRNLPLILTFRYNSEADYWIISITDDISGVMLIDSLPLISGIYPSANMLAQYAFLGIGSIFIVKVNPDNPDVAPNTFNLGKDFQLVWGDTIYE